MASLRRIRAMLVRYLYLHKRSLSRSLEIAFWPVTELMVWGFLAQHLADSAPNQLLNITFALLSGLILWDILYRSQQAISISFMEDIWSQNVVNLLISPLRLWEWHAATFCYGLIKTLIITLILAVLGGLMYHFNLIGALGLWLAPLSAELFIYGWSIGIGTSGILLRWGRAVEALIWGIPFLIQPLSAIFYPVAALPDWLQPVALLLPSTHVCEAMRSLIHNGTVPENTFWMATGLNLLHFALAITVFAFFFRSAREKGRLVKLGLD